MKVRLKQQIHHLCTLHFALRSNIYIPDLASVNISEDCLLALTAFI